MTHVENIPHILQYGITHVSSAHANAHYVDIGDANIITIRGGFVLNNGKALSSYIPFYFGVLMPMLYVIQKGYNRVTTTAAEEIVYCVSSVQQIVDTGLDFVFTDGHAIDKLSTQYTPSDVVRISSLLDFKAIRAKYWIDENDLDLKRRKQAEFLVEGDIPNAAILGFIVYNENAQEKLVAMGIDIKTIVVRKEYYF